MFFKKISFSDCSRAEKQNHIQKTSVGQWTSRSPQKIYIFTFGRTQQGETDRYALLKQILREQKMCRPSVTQ